VLVSFCNILCGCSFNRWEAGQILFTRTLLGNVDAAQAGLEMKVGSMLVDAVRKTLADSGADRSLKAYALTMPAITTVAEEMKTVDPYALAAAYRFTQRGIALELRAEFEAVYTANTLPAQPFRADREAIGMRRLKNTCLTYIAAIEDGPSAALCLGQVHEDAACMTDVLAATAALASCDSSAAAAAREEALALFYNRHAKGNDLLVCKWLRIQVCTSRAAASLWGFISFTLNNSMCQAGRR
jgi:aminopeptidase N